MIAAGALMAHAADPCPATANPGDFCAAFTVKLGRLSVDLEHSRFQTSPAFKAADELSWRRKFSAMVESLLLGGPKLYESGLENTEAAQEKAGAEIGASVANLTAAWTQARQILNQWATKCPDKPAGSPCNRLNADFMLQDTVKKLGGRHLSDTTPFSNPRGTGSLGIAHIQVDDPVGDLTGLKVEYVAGERQPPPTEVFPRAAMLAWLDQNYHGKFWISSEIATRLTDFYSGLGFAPNTFPSVAGQQQRSLTICESRIVARVQLPNKLGDDRRDRAELAKILYTLLSQEDFGRDWTHTIESPGIARILDFAKLRPAGEPLDYLDVLHLADVQAGLQNIGYTIATRDTPSVESKCPPVDLVVAAVSAAPPPATTSSAPKPALNQAKPGSPQVSSVQNLHPLQAPAISPAPAPTDSTAPNPPSPQKSGPSLTFGAGVDYRPGQGVRPLLSFSSPTLTSASGTTSLNALVGADGLHAVGSGEFRQDYILFPQIQRRFSFDLIAGTDNTAQRILGGQLTDERQVGGDARLEFEPFHDWRNSFLQLFVDGASNKLTFSRAGNEIGSLHLNTISLGSTLDISRPARRLPGYLEITPSMLFGLGLATGVPAFQVGSVDALLHQRVSDFKLISVDIAAHFKQASARTPAYQLPSLGGDGVLRGFRLDDALGRRLWSVQTEMWTPVPGTLSATDGGTGFEAFRRFLRQNIRLAALLDVGGVYQVNTASPAFFGNPALNSNQTGTREGVGGGVRYIRGNMALKLDWAYGFGEGQSGSGHGRVYLGVATTRSF